MQCAHQAKGLSGIGREVPRPRPSSPRGMEEFAQVAQRILQNVNAVFDKDRSLDEFDIVPQESQSNRSPVIHTDHKLALESWCVPFLYTHSFGHFIEIRPRKGLQVKNPFLSQAVSNGSSTSLRNNAICHSNLSEEERRAQALELSRMLVLLNPDLAVAWNFRRESFETGCLELRQELGLVTLCATRKPKCSEGFYYRRWLVQQAITNGTIKMDQSLEFFELEVDAARHAATKYLSNYHAWNYRLFILDTWMKCKDVPVELQQSILNREKCASDLWLKTHVSDYCGFHYRQRLLLYCLSLNAGDGKINQLLFQNELDENRNMILYYPGHETLWYHRRNIMKQFTDMLTMGKVEDLKWLHDSEYDLVQLTSSRNKEEKGVGKLSKETGSISEDSSQLNHLFSQRYLKWLKMCLDWKIASYSISDNGNKI